LAFDRLREARARAIFFRSRTEITRQSTPGGGGGGEGAGEQTWFCCSRLRASNLFLQVDMSSARGLNRFNDREEAGERL
jgi:hypothetical protein